MAPAQPSVRPAFDPPSLRPARQRAHRPGYAISSRTRRAPTSPITQAKRTRSKPPCPTLACPTLALCPSAWPKGTRLAANAHAVRSSQNRTCASIGGAGTLLSFPTVTPSAMRPPRRRLFFPAALPRWPRWPWRLPPRKWRRQLEYGHPASQLLSTPRTRVPADPHLTCGGKVSGKPTSLRPLAPG